MLQNLLSAAVVTCALRVKYVVCFFCRSDAEITGYALDAIYNVVSNEPSEEGNVFYLDSR